MLTWESAQRTSGRGCRDFNCPSPPAGDLSLLAGPYLALAILAFGAIFGAAALFSRARTPTD
jgi:hypothetical protein